MPLISTPKATDANSYGSLEEANTYFLERRLNGEAWAAATTQKRTVALIHATKLLDQAFTWYGSLRTLEQSLSWPRAGVWDVNGRYYNYDTVPDLVKEAQFELAFSLLARDRMAAQEPTLLGQGFSKVKVDVIEITVDKSQVIPLIPPTVLTLLEGFGELSGIDNSGGFRQIKLER